MNKKIKKMHGGWNKKYYTKDEINEIILLYRAGMPFTNIAINLGLSRNPVRQILIDNGVFIEGRDNVKIKFTEDDIKKIKDIYLNKKISAADIGKMYNISKGPIKHILKDAGILRKGHSNGVKINLTEKQKDKIIDLYLNGNKNIFEIGKIIGVSASVISNFLYESNNHRNKSQATRISRTGWKFSDATKEKIRKSNQQYVLSGKKKQVGGICKFYNINGIRCQGTYEKFYIEFLINNNKELPENAKSIRTPYGIYCPDFEYEEKLIEVKSDYTYDVLIGKKINRFKHKIDTTQYKKLSWVNDNIKKVQIIVVDKRNNKLINKRINKCAHLDHTE